MSLAEAKLLRHRAGEPTALHRYLRRRDSGQLSCSNLPPSNPP
jgi:hypothetical protein